MKARGRPVNGSSVARRRRGAPAWRTRRVSRSTNSPRLHPKTILVPLDFSAASERALEYARAFASTFGARLILLHVVEAFPIDYLIGLESSQRAHQWLLAHSNRRLKSESRRLLTPGPGVAESLVKYGRPVAEIVAVARARRVDLIIMATRGNTGLKYVELGSTTERVIRHAPCAVLVVRNPARPP